MRKRMLPRGKNFLEKGKRKGSLKFVLQRKGRGGEELEKKKSDNTVHTSQGK
jgi:hypothetical protein